MKKLLILSLLLITLNCNAQYNYKTIDKSNLIIPTTILASTVITVELLKTNYDLYTLDCIAISGIALSAMSYIVIEQVKKNTPKKYRKKRIKKLSRL